MLITKRELIDAKKIKISTDKEITNEDLKQIEGFISLKKIYVDVEASYIDGMDLAIVKLHVKGGLVIKSTRTNNPVVVDFEDNDEITYSFINNEELDDDSIIEVNGDEFDLHDQIISLIVTSLPIKIVGIDEPENFSGDSWEVISEDEYVKRKQNDVSSSPFSALLDLDLED